MKKHPTTRAERLNKDKQAKTNARNWLLDHWGKERGSRLANDPVVVGSKAKHPKCDCEICKPEKFRAERHKWQRVDYSEWE